MTISGAVVHLADLAARYGLDDAEAAAFVRTRAFDFAVVDGDVAIDLADLLRWESSVRLAAEVIDARPRPSVSSPSNEPLELP